MTTAFILDILPKRMKEMGFRKAYRTEHKTVLVSALTTMKIKAWNSWVWFPSEAIPSNIKVTIESNFGILSTSMSSTQYTERQFEHTGKITIQNQGTEAIYLSMIIATPHQNPKH